MIPRFRTSSKQADVFAVLETPCRHAASFFCFLFFCFPSKTWFCMSCVSKTTVPWYNGFLKQWHPNGLRSFCSWTLNRYQLLAGVIEQRMLEPLLHQHKLLLSAASFAVRTGNTFLGSLLWVFCTLRGLTLLSVLISSPTDYASLQVDRLCQVGRRTIGSSIQAQIQLLRASAIWVLHDLLLPCFLQLATTRLLHGTLRTHFYIIL